MTNKNNKKCIVAEIDTSNIAPITALMNEAWIRTYGKNSLHYTDQFFEDHFSGPIYLPELSEGVYLPDGTLVGTLCAFDLPIHYKKLSESVKTAFVTFLVADMKAMRSTRFPIGSELIRNCFYKSKKLGYKQVLTVTAYGESAEKIMRKVVQPIADDDIRVLNNFNVYLFNKKKLLVDKGNYSDSYTHNLLEIENFDECYDFYHSIIDKFDSCHYLNKESMRHNWFGMKTKKSWEVRESGVLKAIISACFSKTHIKSNGDSIALEIYISPDIQDDKKISLISYFLKEFIEDKPEASILIQNSSYINKNILRSVGFFPTMSKFNIVSFPINGKCNFNDDIKEVLINVF